MNKAEAKKYLQDREKKRRDKINLKNSIGFDTFYSDLEKTNALLNDVGTNWKTPTEMEDARNAITGFLPRLKGYQDYMNQYGSIKPTAGLMTYGKTFDDMGISYRDQLLHKTPSAFVEKQMTSPIDSLVNLYENAPAEIDRLKEDYSWFKNKDAYDEYYKVAKKYDSMSSEELKAERDKNKNNTPYSLNHTPTVLEDMFEPVAAMFTETDRETVDKLNSEARTVAYTHPSGQNITWDELIKNAQKREIEEPILSNADFNRNSKYDPSAHPNSALYNLANGKSEGIKFTDAATYGGVKYLTKNEKQILNYLQNTKGEESAQTYYNYIYPWVEKRINQAKKEEWTEYGKEHEILGSLTSLGASFLSGAEQLVNWGKYAFTGDLDTNDMALVSSAIRSGVSDSVDIKIGDWDAFDFVYNTGMSMADSMISTATLGGIGGAINLGLSAAGQSTNDALERGLSNEDAFVTGLAAGLNEAAWEYFSIGKLKAMKEGTADGWRAITQNIAKSMGVNFSEETITEISNKTFDYFYNKEMSQYETDVRRYMAQGMSEEEARSKAKKQHTNQVIEAGLSGALMGLGFGGMSQRSSYQNARALGATIREGGTTSQVFDAASQMTPEEMQKYDAYTRYAKKGITAENIKDAQLGNLYNQTRQAYGQRVTDAQKTLDKETKPQNKRLAEIDSKFEAHKQGKSHLEAGERRALRQERKDIVSAKESSEAKSSLAKAQQDYSALSMTGIRSAINQSLKQEADAKKKEFEKEQKSNFKSEGKRIKKRLGDFNIGEQTKVTDAEGTAKVQGIKVDGENFSVVLDNGESVSVDDMTFSKSDATLIASAEQIATTEGTAVANAFIKNYDGKSDINEYRNTFEQMAIYAKGTFTEDYILKQMNGKLSTEQLNSIYTDLVTAPRKAQQEALDKLVGEVGTDLGNHTAIIDDRVIDYDGTGKGKVKWSSLDARQRDAITFVKAFAKMVGANVTFTESTYNEETKQRKGENGSYTPSSNTITIDVYAGVRGLNVATSNADSIISTFSHELTHWMKEKSPTLYHKIGDKIIGLVSERTGLTEEELIHREMSRLEKAHKGKKFTPEYCRDEIIARGCEDMLSMSEEGRRMFDSMSETEKKGFIGQVKALLNKLLEWVNNLLNGYKSNSEEARILRNYEAELQKLSKMWDEMLVKSIETNKALESKDITGEKLAKAVNDMGTSIGIRDLVDYAKAVDVSGEKLFQYRAIETDKDVYRKMLLSHKDALGITDKDIDALFNLIDDAVDIIKDNLEALDYAWDTDVDDRAFVPVKPNSDSLYKVSLDFSTLCRKRLLQQTIQATLQEALNKPLSREESIAIRDELMKIQEEGKQIEVACALCYVESARMKSPAQITKFFNNREKVLREFFASRSGGTIKEKVKNAETRAREELKKANPNGIKGKHDKDVDILTAKLNTLSKAEADYIRDAKREAKLSYKLTAHEQAELDTALGMSVSDFTSAEGLENLAKNHPDLFDAYTSYIRNATHSKGLEKDTWWRAGDSDLIGDNLIRQMNEENGLRSQSWSDFQVIHLLDYVAATIELSTKGAKRQSYTKVPDYVRLLGNTGDMINMSVIPARAFTGKLEYDDVEGMAYKIAKELRNKYHETAGIICIGIDNGQIKLLLADGTIDMVIPYHKSSMSKMVRKLMHIPTWNNYEAYQQEKKLSDAEAKANAKKYGVTLKKDSNYQKAPKFSEWFNLDEARQIAKMENANPSNAEAYKKYGVMYGGYMAMQNAANNYLKLCAERGLSPKFSHPDANFTGEANYWKLLIDRKMVDNVTGEIIEQKAIKPIFNRNDVLGILNDELERYPKVKADQEYAARKVTEKFLSGEMKVDESTKDAIKKTVDNVTNVNIVESGKDVLVQNSDRDYLSAIERGDMDTAQKMVEQTAKAKGYTQRLYHGTDHFGFTRIDTGVNHGDGISFWASNKAETSGTYTSVPRVREITEEYDDSIAEEVIEEIDSDIDDAVDSFCYKIEKHFSEWVFGYGGGHSLVKDIVEKYFNVSNDTLFDGGLYEELTDIVANAYYGYGEQYHEEYEDFADWEESDEMSEIGEAIVNLESLIVKRNEVYDKFETSGIYQLYGNTDNFFEIDGEGKNWDNIRSVKLPTLSRNGISDVPYTTRDVVKWASENGYDGVIFRNIKDNGGKGYAGLNDVYAFFKPQSQVKSADPVTYDDNGNIIPLSQRFNSESDDIRYQDRYTESIYDLMGENEKLKRTNEILKADVERLKELVKLEKTLTHGKVFKGVSLEAVAKHLKEKATSTIDIKELAKMLNDEVYSFIANSTEKDWAREDFWAEVQQRSYNVASKIVAETKTQTMIDDYPKMILKDIRSSPIWLSEGQISELKYKYGDRWHDRFFGKITTTKDSKHDLENKWREWSEQYPGIFSADVNEAEMGIELIETYDRLREASEIVMEFDTEEATRSLMAEVYGQYWNLKRFESTADKYNKRIKELNAQHRTAMKELRSTYSERMKATVSKAVEKQSLSDDMYYGRKKLELKNKYEAKLREQHKADKEKATALVKKLREQRDEGISEAKRVGRERMSNYKTELERKRRIQSITANTLALKRKLLKNSPDEHIPEVMKPVVIAFVNALDFSSKRMLEKGIPTQKDISLYKALEKVKDMMSEANANKEAYAELAGIISDENVKKLVESAWDIKEKLGDNEFILNNMPVDRLESLDHVVRAIKYIVNQTNKFYVANHAKGITNLAQETMSDMNSLGKAKLHDGLRASAEKMLKWGNAIPYYAFKRFGEGGRKIFEAFQNGWDKLAFNIKQIVDYANETYTDKEVKEWAEDVKTFKILIPATESDLSNPEYKPQYQEVQMTVPQIMSLYALQKREQAKGHMLGGGIRVADFKTKKGEKVSQAEGAVLTQKDIDTIVGTLTDRQKSVADKLQEFMNTVCSDWGNYVSMTRFGYEAFGEENYFPIQSDDNNLAVNDATEQNNSLFRLLNMSFSKSLTENANNRIVISDIFDVFAQHTSDMAKYNALALPVLDAFRWYNYTETAEAGDTAFTTNGVKQSIETAYGKDAQNYIITFLKDINGTQEVSRDTLGKGFYSKAKIAAVGANLRVVALQPTSYLRANAVINPKYLTRAFAHKPKIAYAEKYCGIALWKSMGYYDTNVQKGVEELIKHNKTFGDKATDIAMKGAEWADKVTWGYLWNACELEIRDTRKDLKVGSKEFFEEVGKRLREAIYATQVVDSTMTRSQMMRSSDGWDKMLTAFASEPTLSYNMLMDAYMGYSLDAKKMGMTEAIKKNGKRIARIVFAYTVTNALAALVESGFDALRDDDDEEKDGAYFMSLYLENFANDMSITAKIPYIKEIHSILKGFRPSRTDTQWMETFIQAGKAWAKDGLSVKSVKSSIKAFSYVSGLPFYNAYRDAMAVLDKTEILTAEDLEKMFSDFIN